MARYVNAATLRGGKQHHSRGRNPIRKFDTVVVPAREAWEEYLAHGVYICQPNRTFRPIERIAFYESKSIKIDLPLVTGRIDNVEWNLAEQTKLLASWRVALGGTASPLRWY